MENKDIIIASIASDSSTTADCGSNNKERKRQHRWEQKNRWMVHYELKYGVVPIEFVLTGSDNGGSAVASVAAATTPVADDALLVDNIPVVLKAKCRFCECFGRETVATAMNNAVGTNISNNNNAVGVSKRPHTVSGSAPEDGNEPDDDTTDFAAAVTGCSSELSSSHAPTGHTLTHHGNSDASDAPVRATKRRKKRQTLKVFGPNFRTDNLESHLSREHPTKWRDYERLRDEDKKHFFAFATASGINDLLLRHATILPTTNTINTLTSNEQQQHSDLVAVTGVNPTDTHRTSVSGVVGFSPSGLFGPKMLLFSDKQPQQPNNSNATTATIAEPTTASIESDTTPTTTTHVVPLRVLDLFDQLLAPRHTNVHSTANAWCQAFVRLNDADDDRNDANAALAAATATRLPLPASSSSSTSLAPHTDDATIAIPLAKTDALGAFVVDALALGLSIDATRALVDAAERYKRSAIGATSAAPQTTTTATDMRASVCAIAAINVSTIAHLVANAWGVTVLLRFVTRHSIGYVDVCVQLAGAAAGDTDDSHTSEYFHVVALPLDGHKHSPAAVATAIRHVLLAVEPRVLEKLVGVLVDGDPFHMRAFAHVASLLRDAVVRPTAAPSSTITSTSSSHTSNTRSNASPACYVLYTGAYHINRIANEVLATCQADFEVVTTLADLDALSAAHASLVDAMGPRPHYASSQWNKHSSSTCIALTTPHWLDVLHACEWFALQRETLTKWCHDHDERDRVPSTTSWLAVLLVRDLLKDAASTYTKCVEHAQTFTDVQRYVCDLVRQFKLKFNITGHSSSGSSDSRRGMASAMAADSSVATSSEEGEIDVDAAAAAVSDTADATATSPPSSLQPLLVDSSACCAYEDFVHAVTSLDLLVYEAFQRQSIDGVGDVERMHIYTRFSALLCLFLRECERLASASAVSTGPVGRSSRSSNSNSSSSHRPTDSTSMDADNDFSIELLPPTTPLDFITMPSVAFMALLSSQQTRIRATWSGKALAMLPDARSRLVAEFATQGALFEAVTLGAKQQQQHGAMSLCELWHSAAAAASVSSSSGSGSSNSTSSASPFASLCRFALALGSLLAVPKPAHAVVVAVASTASSLLSCSPMSLTLATLSNVQLEAQLHARQLDRLASLRKNFDAVV